MKENEVRVVNMMLFSKIECTGERLSQINVYEHKKVNQQANNNLYTI